MASHYKMTLGRQEHILDALKPVFARRVSTVAAAWPLSLEELHMLLWDDETLRMFRSIDALEARVVRRLDATALALPAPAGSRVTTAYVHFDESGYGFIPRGAGRMPPSPQGKLSAVIDSDPAQPLGNYALPHPDQFNFDPVRRDLSEQVLAWAADMNYAARRHDLAVDLAARLVVSAPTTTVIQASLPDVRAVLPADSDLPRLMDAAPTRTLHQYHTTHLNAREISALRTLLAEGLVLPAEATTDKNIKVTRYAYEPPSKEQPR